MVEGHRSTHMPWRLNERASSGKTGTGTLPAGHRERSRRHLGFATPAGLEPGVVTKQAETYTGYIRLW